jgi:UDP-N-acetylglucosamine 2-epimerase
MDKIRVNQEHIRAREVIAKLKSNNKKAHELRHTARNLQTVSRLMLEEIRWRRHRNLTNH